MRRFGSPILILVLLWLGANALPASASVRCDVQAADLAEIEWDELVEVLMEPGCASMVDATAAELSARIERRQWPEDSDTEERTMVELVIEMARVRSALWQQDLPLARRLLAEALPRVEKAAAEFELVEPEDFNALWKGRLQEVTRIIDGRGPVSLPTPIELAPAEWTIESSRCGMPAASFLLQSMFLIDAADAYVAIGRPELGLQVLLSEQWVDAISLGVEPPHLRALVERASGAGAYEQEIEAALQGIRIEDAIAGRRAHLPLFGLWLPVPLARKSWAEEAVERFDSKEQIAQYLRQILLSDD